MSSNWPTVQLGKYCSKIGSGATPRGGSSVYMDEGEISLIRSQNIYNEGFKSDGLVYITEEAAHKLKNVVIQSGDVLINITGDSVARVCLAPVDFLSSRVNQHVAILRVDPAEFDHRYLRYYLTSPKVQNYLLTIASTGGTRNALTKTMLETLEVSKPPLDIQKKIGDILESVESKIELNTYTNQTLEEMAQAIFKSWFVDFDPVKAKMRGEQPEGMDAETASLFPDKLVESELGLIPDGWFQGSIADIAKLNAKSWTKKKHPDEVHYVDLANTKNGVIEAITTYDFDDSPSRARRVLNSGDTIVGTVRPGNRSFAYVGDTEQSLTGSTGFAVLSPKEDFWSSFVYLAATNDDAIDEYARLADGGAYPAIKPAVVANTEYAIPEEVVAKKFWEITGPLLKKAHQNRLENEDLAVLRDTLLPRVLSGEIDLETLPFEAK